MKEHQKRMRDIFERATPLKGSPEYESLRKALDEGLQNDPQKAKWFKEQLERAKNNLWIQYANGIGLGMDQEIRHFLREFNRRLWGHGLRSLPTLFNIMEPFFKYDKNIIYFELLEEEDYLFSFFDFWSAYENGSIETSIEAVRDVIEKDLIYNFNIGADIDGLRIKNVGGEEFVVGGISIVRREDEVVILIQFGHILNTSEVTKNLKFDPIFTNPGHKGIAPNKDLKLEAVKLNDNPNYWKGLVICRFDLESQTVDDKYVAMDIGLAHMIFTNSASVFWDQDGNWLSPDSMSQFGEQILEIERYGPIFEVAKAAMHLPSYFEAYEAKILEESHETGLRKELTSVQNRRKSRTVPNSFRLNTRTLWILNLGNKFNGDRIIIRDQFFRIESNGYWRTLFPDEVGMDKKGRQIAGKTWVNTKESYYKAKTDDLMVLNSTSKVFEGENAGFIYVMRNPHFPENTFKVGRSKDPKGRADQLSKTSVPDRFHLINQWAVIDCLAAEKKIHESLNAYRDDPRREFFTLEMEKIVATINKVVREINPQD